MNTAFNTAFGPSASSSKGKSGDAAAVGKRLQNELMQLMLSKTPGVSAFPEAENLLK